MSEAGAIRRGAAALFGLALKARSFGFDQGLLSTSRVGGIVVISVGNLKLGGSGKTPLVMCLARRLQRAGKRTAVVSRGYKGRLELLGGMVSDGSGPVVPADRSGDEAYLLAARLPGVDVYVGSDRAQSVRAARDRGAEVAILDDGFSHRQLHRDLDILLASPEDLSENAALFPKGDLRELPEAAARAHLIGGFDADWQRRRADFTFTHVPTCLVDADNKTHPFSSQKQQTAHLLAGIARPHRFFNTARDAGFTALQKSIFPDHHPFSSRDLHRIFSSALASGADMVLTTEKDLARLPKRAFPLPVLALRIETQIVLGQDTLDAALSHLFSRNG